MRERIRAVDWSKTSLGAMDTWPQRLRGIVDLMLDALQPVFVAAGPELLSLYNDAFARILGGRHPQALARPYREVFADIWDDDIQSAMEDFLAGKSRLFTDRRYRLPWRPEQDCWFTFSWTPLRDDSGAVFGAVAMSTDTTARVIAEHRARETEDRQAFLLELSDAIRAQSDEAAIGALCTRRLAEHLQLDRCSFAEFHPDEGRVTVGPEYRRTDLKPATGDYRLADFPEAVRKIQTETLVFNDVACDQALSETDKRALAAIDFGAYIAAPVRRGRREVLWALAAASVKPRTWARGEVMLVEEVAERTWVSIERIRVESALRESEERYRTLFDQMVAGVAESDLDGCIITANDRYCEILGYPREEILRLKMQDITHPDDLPGNLEQFQRCREEGTAFEIEKRYIRKDGSIVWVHNSVSLVRDAQGRPKSLVAAVLDVTHRVRSEQALADASRAKDEFLAMLGHELRNPLSPIVTTLQLMKLRAPDTLAAERGVIEKQVHYISDMVDDLLDVTRIARGKVELKTAPVQITEVAAAAIETTQPLFEERGQMLHTAIRDGLVVSGDRRRLVQVVVNLLANAAKYSPRGRAIYFSAAAEGNEVVLRVRDEGVGIDPALLPRVFELFTQDEQSIERSRGGLGLGLAIVRNLIEMHGGSVSASSAGRDRGSEFVVRLPLLERRAKPTAESSPATPVHRADRRAEPIRVLIVDDYVLAAESLGALLQELGFETHITHDGASALAAVRQFQPSIALVDIGLPVMDGYEVARRLRRTPGSERMPIVALTGYGQESDRERVRQAGFDEHLVKPVDAERIGAVIERLVKA